MESAEGHGELVAVAPSNQQCGASGQVHALEEQRLDQRQREARQLGPMVVERFGRGSHAENVRALDFRESELRRAVQGELERLELAKQREPEDAELCAGLGAPFD